MAVVLMLVGAVIVVASMDIAIKRVYGYPKEPHETTPAFPIEGIATATSIQNSGAK